MTLVVCCSSPRVVKLLRTVTALVSVTDGDCWMRTFLMPFHSLLIEEVVFTDNTGPGIREWVLEDLVDSLHQLSTA